MRRFSLAVMAAAAMLGAVTAPVLAQTRVRTQIVRPSAPPADAGNKPDSPPVTIITPSRKALAAPAQNVTPPEIITDLSRLPAPVARMRERILEAARSGSLERLVTVMQSNELMPIFSLDDEKNPLSYWKTNYPDSDGVEILATLINILETGFVHVDAGTPQELYLWPYFARMPVKSLTPEQKVELFRLVTGTDYRDMVEFGAYNFYRLGIGSDGTWHFFVTGD
ncbi:MAG TPA: hypothetical protein VGH49_02505 [Xanthobacteraceae bacterium]